MAEDFVPYHIPPCPEPEPEPEIVKCPEWSICLPFGGRLYSHDGCVYAENGNPPADGVYGKVVIANGCIIGVEPIEACVDNIAPCADNPAPCSGGSDSGCCEPSSASGNLYALDITGKPLVRCSIREGTGVSITGNGTDSNPYIISASAIGVSRVYITNGDDAIKVTGNGSYASPFVIGHKTGQDGLHNGLTFDQYGHLIGVGDGSANKGVSAVVGSDTIDAETNQNTGIVTVKLKNPAKPRNGTYHIGGYKVELDNYNRIFDVQREITDDAGTYAFGAFDVGVTDTGSISDIVASNAGLGANFIFNWPAGGTPKKRTAAFTLRFSTALGGLLYTAGTEAFWAGLKIFIDNLEASTLSDKDSPLPFWNFGFFTAGKHTLTVQSTTAWSAEAGATVVLHVITQPDELSEI